MKSGGGNEEIDVEMVDTEAEEKYSDKHHKRRQSVYKDKKSSHHSSMISTVACFW